MHTCNT